MSKNVRKHYLLLCALCHINSKQRKPILENAEASFIQAISECIINVLKGNVPLTLKQKKKLLKYRKLLRNVANKKESIKKRKQLLVKQQGAGIFSVLIPAAVGLLSSILGR